MHGGMSGKRRLGRPRTRLLDTLTNVKGPSINIMIQVARARAMWINATA